MQGNNFRELFRRYEHNPMLTADDWPYPSNIVFNPGATRLPDGETLLLMRVEDHRGIRTYGGAQPGRDHRLAVDSGRRCGPTRRIIPKKSGVSRIRASRSRPSWNNTRSSTRRIRGGPLVSLALTRDFREFERLGVTCRRKTRTPRCCRAASKDAGR